MKLKDIYVILGVFLLLSPFFLFDEVYKFYTDFNSSHGLLTAFIKFAILATFGESLGLRIREGVYNRSGFGIMPRAIVWGLLGITIKIAFVIFASGTPAFLNYLGFDDAQSALKGGFSINKLLTAFSVSVAMNLVYAPVMMTFHKISDTHILLYGGKLSALIKKIRFAEIFKSINWDIQWHFVFKKTIPFFWIPAHTVTFLLSENYQVLFAALLGIALGLILAVASLKN